MRAVDTNLIIRYLTNDDPAQSSLARDIINNEDFFVSSTVLLETEWVLRSVYGFSRIRILAALQFFAGLPHIRMEDSSLAAQALIWAEAGMDFADALHLAKADGCTSFVTFDKALARSARKLGNSQVEMI